MCVCVGVLYTVVCIAFRVRGALGILEMNTSFHVRTLYIGLDVSIHLVYVLNKMST